MSDLHQRAQAIASEASLLRLPGDSERRRQLYARAAELESLAVAEVPSDKRRTFGLLSVSAAALFYKAGMSDRAEHLILASLSSGRPLPSEMQQLRELVGSIWDEASLKRETYSDEEITVGLRGGPVGAGTAPIELALRAQLNFVNILYRVGEDVGGFQFRERGRPSPDVAEAVVIRATQPAVGSFRFGLRLMAPAQGRLLSRSVEPERVSEQFFAIADAVAQGDDVRLISVLPQEGPRKALVRLFRDVTPTAERAELELVRHSHGVFATTVIRPGSRPFLTGLLRTEPDPSEADVEIRGVLRAVNLDAHTIQIDTDGRQEIKGTIPANIYDDSIGPLMNRRVVAPARQRGAKFHFLDVELDHDAPPEEGDAA